VKRAGCVSDFSNMWLTFRYTSECSVMKSFKIVFLAEQYGWKAKLSDKV